MVMVTREEQNLSQIKAMWSSFALLQIPLYLTQARMKVGRPKTSAKALLRDSCTGLLLPAWAEIQYAALLGLFCLWGPWHMRPAFPCHCLYSPLHSFWPEWAEPLPQVQELPSSRCSHAGRLDEGVLFFLWRRENFNHAPSVLRAVGEDLVLFC